MSNVEGVRHVMLRSMQLSSSGRLKRARLKTSFITCPIGRVVGKFSDSEAFLKDSSVNALPSTWTLTHPIKLRRISTCLPSYLTHPSCKSHLSSNIFSFRSNRHFEVRLPLHTITRHSSTTASPLTALFSCPEFTPTLWGFSGLLLTAFHTQLHLPYWACMSLTNIFVRTSLIPVVIQGAKTSVSFGKVAPEVQYLISIFQNDFSHLKKMQTTSIGTNTGDAVATKAMQAQLALVKYTMQSLRGIFKLHKVNLLDIFKSPFLQIPIFWYFSIDIRKIINGSDPPLAQELVESSFLWITDLTEPDPWYGLPILTGLLLYVNVETSVGKRALSGETSSQSRMALVLKDFFQSLAIFMPCFMAQQPSGVQIYLMTSMVFSLIQSIAMRNDGVREMVGLPSLYSKPKAMQEGIYVQEFIQQMKERQEAKARGEFILGEGVLRIGAPEARSGEKRTSSIQVESKEGGSMMDLNALISQQSVGNTNSSQTKMSVVAIELPRYSLSSLLVDPANYQGAARRPTPLLPPEAISSPDSSITSSIHSSDYSLQSMPEIPLSVMEAANRGERPVQIEMAPKVILEQREVTKRRMVPIDVEKLKMKRDKHKGKSSKKGK